MVDIQGNVSPQFQVVLRDALSEPLVNGSMETFKDSARTTHKATYSDRPRTTPLPNPIPANAAGVLSDGTGTPVPLYLSDDENYYLVIRDSAGAIVQTIPNWNADNAFSTHPQFDEIVTTNYIPNAQFRSLVNGKTLYSNDDLNVGNAVLIARDNWYLRRDVLTSTNTLEFKEFAVGQTDVPFNPKYYLNFSCSVGSTEIEKDATVDIGDADSFSNQEVTFSIWAKSSTLSTIEIIADQDFGGGGSTPVKPIVDSFVLTNDWAQYSTTFTVADVTAKTLGTNNRFRMRVRYPLNAICNVDISEPQLNIGDTILEFDYQPLIMNDGNASKDAIPQPTDTDGGKSLTLNEDNITNEWRSNPPIGCPVAFAGKASKLPDGYLLCDHTLYKSSDYQRLADIIEQQWGFDFFGIQGFASIGATYTYFTGEPGTVIAAADVSTGFTITNTTLGTDNDVRAYLRDTDKGIMLPKAVGSVTASAAATSPFTIVFEDGNALIPARTFITFTDGSTIVGGNYWTYSVPTPTNYYVWYKVDGAGADPAPGGTGVLVEVLSTDTAETVAARTMAVLDQRALIKILTVAASAMSGGDYFTINSTNYDYGIWYSIDGAGTAPSLPGKEVIEVALLSTDTAIQVQQKTNDVFTIYTFRVPDFRGYTLKGVDPSGANDPNYDQRLRIGGGESEEAGSIELDFVRSHRHPPTVGNGYIQNVEPPGGNRAAGGNAHLSSSFTGFFGKEQNTVLNAYVNYIIKY